MPRQFSTIAYSCLLGLVCSGGCGLFEVESIKLPDAGPSAAEARSSGCPADFTSCGGVCCAPGKRCVDGACKYPYTNASLYVYLCPSFNMGCSANFFALDQTCSPIRDAQPGTCYDTGFDVAAASSYALASCQACGSNCGSPVSLNTPAGFTSPEFYSGVTWFCGAKCEAPPECGGRSGATTTRCSTLDCWLSSLSLRENGNEVPLVIIDRASAPSSTAAAKPNQTPKITKLNGVAVGSTATSQSITLTALRTAGLTARFEYEFSDPNGCSPGVCFSVTRCPSGVRCTLPSTTVCSRIQRDGARSGSVIRTLGFKAEPADAAGVELALQVQPITGPMDPATGTCTDPIAASDPQHVTFANEALVGDILEATVLVSGTNTSGAAGSSGAAGRAASAGAGGAAIDCSCRCDNGRVCMSHADCGIDADGIPNVCGCPVGPPCR